MEQLDKPNEGTEQAVVEAEKDIFDMSDAEFDEFESQHPDEGDEPATDTPDPEPEKEAPAEAEQEQSEPEQKAEEVEDEPAKGALEAMQAKIDELEKQNKIIREYQENPKEFLRKNPELRKQFASAHEELTSQESLPPWTTADPAIVRLPNDQRFGKLAGRTPQELNELGYEDEAQQAYGYIEKEQIAARVRMEERARLKQGQEQEQLMGRAQEGWNKYMDGVAKEHPDWTDEQKSQHMIEVANYMTNSVTPGDIARLMNIDNELKAAKEAGFEEGRKSALADLNISGSAPSSAKGQGGAATGTLLDKFKAMTPASRADFFDNCTEKEFDELEKQAKENKVDLDSL
jgi:hypothetical protein